MCEKGPYHTFSEFHFKIHNLESIAATDFYFGVMILTSSCYTHKDFCATPTSGLGGSYPKWLGCMQFSDTCPTDPAVS